MTIRVVEDAAALARAAAEEVTQRAVEAARTQRCFRIALAGGSTPRALYRLLADAVEFPPAARFPWSATQIFWGDERHVPPDHPDSNYRMAREALLDHVPLPAANVHRIPAEDPDAAGAAVRYDAELSQAFALTAAELPRFDLVLLGLGPEGHTASLFPGSDVIRESTLRVAAPYVPKLAAFRITLTPPVLNHAAAVVFLVSGADKAPALAAVIEGEPQPDLYPAQIVRPRNGTLLWLVDRTAAQRLRRT
jgi:6-phosphogluconolactonase